MALISHGISSFIGGVSQQPPIQRHPSQVDAMENMVPSVASGLRKRIGSAHVAKLTNTDWTQAFVHAINRGTPGTDERYFTIIDQGDLKVFDWFGTEKTVAFPDGKSYLSSGPAGSLARNIFRAVTVADYTFIVNKAVPVTMTSAVPSAVTPTFFVVVKLGVANTTYHVNLGGVDYQYANASTTDTLTIAQSLHTAINSGGTYTSVRQDNLLRITKTAGGDFAGACTDSYGDAALFGFKDTVERFEELPRKFVANVTVKVQAAPDNSNAVYYVRWQQSVNTADGVWVETTAPNIDVALNAASMPYQLVRESNGTFTFRKAVWDDRKVGDDETNSLPSFTGHTIEDLFFFRNRLGLLSDENVVMSEVGKYWNFWRTTARTDIDSDPVDVSASTNKVTLLHYALPFEKSILLFSDQHQFQLSSGDTLTGRTARLDPTTAYAASSLCRPVALGKSVYFPTVRGNATAIREYYYDATAVTSDAADVTAHVPSYIPDGVFRMSVAPTEDQLLVQVEGERNVLYVYNSYWNGTDKVQSAWHRWYFHPDDVIVSADVFGSTLALIVKRADGVYLDTMALEENPDSPATYQICVDRKVNMVAGQWQPGTGRTYWTLPYAAPSESQVRVVLCTAPGAYGQGLIAQRESNTVFSVRGNYASARAVLGIDYMALFQLSQQFMPDPSNKDGKIADARLTLRDLSFAFTSTGYFEVIVQPTARVAREHVYSGRRLGLQSLQLGFAQVTDGTFRVPIMARSDEVLIMVQNFTHLPSVFQSASWQANAAMQSMRR